MINELNSIPLLTPAFNKSLLKVESDNILFEKFNYVTDILLNEFFSQYLGDALYGNPEYAGFVSIWGTQGASEYVVGDKVIVFDNTNNYYTGIHRVKAVPNDSVIILDTPFTGFALFLGECYVYKLKRNKLPIAPDGTATFNLNNFAPSIVTFHYIAEEYGMFNVPENFERFKYLLSEEYYKPISFTQIAGFSGFGFTNVARVTDPDYLPNEGDKIVITQDTGTDYNGTWTVLKVIGTEFIFSANYVGTYNGNGVANLQPKVVQNPLDYDDISDYRFAFNGALPFPKDLSFDGVEYDATLTQPCKFLTTIPNGTKMKPNDKGYIHFFQSDKLSVTQYVIDVTDENGVIQQYIVNLPTNQGSDYMQGVSVGAGDLNNIDPLYFESIPARGLPVIQECDKSYEVYLWGNLGCTAGGIQLVQFQHPIPNILSNPYWLSNGWYQMFVQVLQFEIGGVPQLISPTQLGPYSRNLITGQTNEDYYADAIATMTNSVPLIVQNSTQLNTNPFPTIFNGHGIQIDFDQDFLLKTRIIMKRRFGVWEFISKLPPYLGQSYDAIFEICYQWDSTLCQWTYSVNNLDKQGFVGLVGGTGITPQQQMSEKKLFNIDWTCCSYTGARLLFEDRLGSIPGMNFSLKQFNEHQVSSDGFEQNLFTIDRNEQTRGFTTIQSSYEDILTLHSDYVSQDEYDYFVEAMSSPNAYVQIGTEVIPCMVLPQKKILETKENNQIIRFEIQVKIYGTQYSQRN